MLNLRRRFPWFQRRHAVAKRSTPTSTPADAAAVDGDAMPEVQAHKPQMMLQKILFEGRRAACWERYIEVGMGTIPSAKDETNHRSKAETILHFKCSPIDG